jgi:hypothetical protein
MAIPDTLKRLTAPPSKLKRSIKTGVVLEIPLLRDNELLCPLEFTCGRFAH